MEDTNPEISRARAALIAEDMGLNDRPVEPASNEDMAALGPWVVTPEKVDGSCTMFLVELEEPMSMGDWALSLWQMADEEVEGIVGHATHSATKPSSTSPRSHAAEWRARS